MREDFAGRSVNIGDKNLFRVFRESSRGNWYVTNIPAYSEQEAKTRVAAYYHLGINSGYIKGSDLDAIHECEKRNKNE